MVVESRLVEVISRFEAHREIHLYLSKAMRGNKLVIRGNTKFKAVKIEKKKKASSSPKKTRT